jgi:hypothetical protein
VDLAAEQCNSGRKEIRAALGKNCSFTSHNGDVIVTIDECELPEAKRRSKTNPRRPTAKPGRKRYKAVPLEAMVGKTVEAIARDTAPGACGRDRVVRLLFSDGTQHGFVVPDDEDE